MSKSKDLKQYSLTREDAFSRAEYLASCEADDDEFCVAAFAWFRMGHPDFDTCIGILAATGKTLTEALLIQMYPPTGNPGGWK